MGQINDRLRSQEDAFFKFWCPGCEETHAIPSTRGWTFDGNFSAPTIQPSLLIRSGHYAGHFRAGTDSCWCTYNAEQIAKGEKPCKFTCGVCHSYITAGRIQFLADCTHPLAGKTVEIPLLPDNMKDDA